MWNYAVSYDWKKLKKCSKHFFRSIFGHFCQKTVKNCHFNQKWCIFLESCSLEFDNFLHEALSLCNLCDCFAVLENIKKRHFSPLWPPLPPIIKCLNNFFRNSFTWNMISIVEVEIVGFLVRGPQGGFGPITCHSSLSVCLSVSVHQFF